MKKTKGITLIALVITIIILLILAGITISLTIGQMGILRRAQEAGKNYMDAAKEEDKQLSKLLNYENTEQEEIEPEIQALQVGDYIKYDTGIASLGNNGIITCRVLYPTSSPNGLQIISDKPVGANIMIEGHTWDNAKQSWNRLIQTLNEGAQIYLNTDYAYDARCVGSLPMTQNGMFVDKNKGTETTVTTKWGEETGAYDTDTNYSQDEAILTKNNMWQTTENYYLASRYVASKEDEIQFYIRWVNTDGTINDHYYLLGTNAEGNQSSYEREYKIRPCMSLKSNNIDIVSGDGKSEETAYEIKTKTSKTEQERKIEELKVGHYIKYNTGVSTVGENGVITCRVLYSVNSPYGLQIISDQAIGNNITIAGNTWETAKTSWNRMIQTLNEAASNYMNSQYAYDARCVGSIPMVQNNSFTEKNKGSNHTAITKWNKNDTGCYDTDLNYVQDRIILTTANMWQVGENYYLASRYVRSQENGINYYIRWVNPDGGINISQYLFGMDSAGNTDNYTREYKIRPCILLKSDKINIIGGDGKSPETAFIIE